MSWSSRRLGLPGYETVGSSSRSQIESHNETLNESSSDNYHYNERRLANFAQQSSRATFGLQLKFNWRICKRFSKLLETIASLIL